MLETHHRVKNNLQVVGAMIDMQVIESMQEETLPLTKLERLGNHIHTLATVHDLLTTSVREDEHEQRVSSNAVIGRLLELLKDTCGTREIKFHMSDVDMLSKQAISLSMIINELVSNAAKHSATHIEVSFSNDGAMATLTVCDDGPGFPPGFDPAVQSNLGLELVLNLVTSDLNGTASFENKADGGARVVVTFSLPNDNTTGTRTDKHRGGEL